MICFVIIRINQLLIKDIWLSNKNKPLCSAVKIYFFNHMEYKGWSLST